MIKIIEVKFFKGNKLKRTEQRRVIVEGNTMRFTRPLNPRKGERVEFEKHYKLID
jgi:hypothetical protein